MMDDDGRSRSPETVSCTLPSMAVDDLMAMYPAASRPSQAVRMAVQDAIRCNPLLDDIDLHDLCDYIENQSD